MGKVLNGVVVSDILFTEYHKFKKGEACNTEMVKRLLHYYKHEIVANVGQYEKNKVEISSNLKAQLTHSGFKRQSLEDLAEQNTIYKIVLNTERNDFPYINIMDDNEKLENNFSSSFDVSEIRQRAFEHFAAICKHAKDITIYDKYFSREMNNVFALEKILPKKKIDIHYSYDSAKDVGIRDEDVLKLKEICSDWNFIKESILNKRHDRYLIIDNSIEIILSSGFDHLNNDNSDFTYLIRPITSSRFK
ncbi:hypothetical protein [Bacteroides timonensis]|uniref:hypothetical protein n=1 Tax=Bacteroides timonensis TaxID=1470345 RepID=UPI0004B4BEBE|nr:hypothetical protein [Bacteroides timonensis]